MNIRRIQTNFRTNLKIASTFLFLAGTGTASAKLTLFAAASTTDVMKELAAEFAAGDGEPVQFNFAGSGALARQIDAGAPADLFISANAKWMDFLEARNLIRNDSRTVVAENSLVLIAPSDSTLTYSGFPRNLKGRLAIGEPKSVPAGAYAQQALESLHQFDAVKPSLIKGKDVRTVLLYVARGEVEAGMVYATDARYSDQVKVLGTFPDDTHPPIIYPAACLKNGSPEADAFLTFLKSEPAKRIFRKHGFSE